MFKHKLIDTLAAIITLTVGAALATSAALAVRMPEPVGGSGATPVPAPIHPADVGTNWGLNVSFAIAGLAFIVLAALGTRAISRRQGTSPA